MEMSSDERGRKVELEDEDETQYSRAMKLEDLSIRIFVYVHSVINSLGPFFVNTTRTTKTQAQAS
jgi:hypothetical protein